MIGCMSSAGRASQRCLLKVAPRNDNHDHKITYQNIGLVARIYYADHPKLPSIRKFYHAKMTSSISDLILPELADYAIDLNTGFAAICTPDLPPYYQPWKALIVSLPELLKTQRLRNEVDRLPILSTTSLTHNAHWQRAYVFLGYLIQAYIWEDKHTPASIVPPCLGEPFTSVCSRLGLMPVLSYAGLCLWNCAPRLGKTDGTTSTHDAELSLTNLHTSLNNFEHIQSSASFTGTRDEDAFNLVPVMVEAEGAKLIPLLLQTLQAGTNGDQATMTANLQFCAATLKKMIAMLTVLNDVCHPQVFYHDIRPFLAGSAGSVSLPDGVSLTMSNGSANKVKCVGGSAAQSSLFQYFDRILSIEHTSKMLLDMRAYMPGKHREFLTIVDQYPSVREQVERFPENVELQSALKLCVSNLQQWRTKHVAVVARYIVQPSGGGTEIGTAGSLPVPFLKQYRDETRLGSDL